jgi:hypothetical protein
MVLRYGLGDLGGGLRQESPKVPRHGIDKPLRRPGGGLGAPRQALLKQNLARSPVYQRNFDLRIGKILI